MKKNKIRYRLKDNIKITLVLLIMFISFYFIAIHRVNDLNNNMNSNENITNINK